MMLRSEINFQYHAGELHLLTSILTFFTEENKTDTQGSLKLRDKLVGKLRIELDF
jgi:hypothetical protein